jgi:IS30 family transposase
LTRRQIKRVQHLMNERPRKVLDWRSPYEAFNDLLH